MAMEKARVCVTGAGGFMASSLVKLLLSRDYFVHGTVRNPTDQKYAHLSEFKKASEKLKLFKVDLLDSSSLRTAIEGCDAVFHVASPVPSSSVANPQSFVVAMLEKVTATFSRGIDSVFSGSFLVGQNSKETDVLLKELLSAGGVRTSYLSGNDLVHDAQLDSNLTVAFIRKVWSS